MIAAMLLGDLFDLRAAPAPLRGEDLAAAVGCGFLEAGRLDAHQPLQRRQHLRQARL
jgi:hypothetical protein